MAPGFVSDLDHGKQACGTSGRVCRAVCAVRMSRKDSSGRWRVANRGSNGLSSW